MVNHSSEIKGNNNPLSLKDYYQNLPEASYPKTEFIKTVADRCSVSITTVRYWVLEGRVPTNPKHLKVLEELTGIPSIQLLEGRSRNERS